MGNCKTKDIVKEIQEVRERSNNLEDKITKIFDKVENLFSIICVEKKEEIKKETKKEVELFEIGEVEEKAPPKNETAKNRQTYAMIQNIKDENEKLKSELKKKIDRQF